MAAITIYSPAVAPQPGYAGLWPRLLCFQTIRSTLLAGRHRSQSPLPPGEG